MENNLLGIGKVATLSGLPVSALRFYDGAGVLVPAWVDPATGYRYYQPHQANQARVVAHLRRVSLPVNEIRAVLTNLPDAATILDAHLARLEAGLADARREISIVHHLLDTSETRMHAVTVPAPAFLAALREVRYAVGTDPNHPRLHGIYLDSEPGGIRLVATDRHRLVTRLVPTAEPTDLHVLLPTEAVDELARSDADGTLDIVLDREDVTITTADATVRARVPNVDFPSYRSLLECGRHTVNIDAAQLRSALEAGPRAAWPGGPGESPVEVSLLRVGPDGVHVSAASSVATGADTDPERARIVAVNHDFLLQALPSHGQLTLGFDDPITPLAIRDQRREGALAIIMPVRHEQRA